MSVVAKATFRLPELNKHRATELSAEQLPVFHEDQHLGEPETSSVHYPIDLVLQKAGSDIIVVGNAYSPRATPVTSLDVSVRVGDVKSTLWVVGDRWWKTAKSTRPEPFTVMPLTYERAFGGRDKDGAYGTNPVGKGYRLNRSDVEAHPLPNIEHPEHRIKHWKDKPPVASFGAVASSWEPRRQYAGTYDDRWRDEKFPLLPDDFDIRYFSVAPTPLQLDRTLRGGEIVELTNVSPRGTLRFQLPIGNVWFVFRFAARSVTVKGELWTLILEPDLDQLVMVWGASQALGKMPSQMRFVQIFADGDLNTSPETCESP